MKILNTKALQSAFYTLIVLTATAYALPVNSQQKERRIKDMMELPAYSTNKNEQVIFHKAYTTSYNSKHKIPNWVAWRLTKKNTSGKVSRYKTFLADPLVRGYCPEHKDYSNSGYDRGHMCPAMDNKYSQTAMKECFYMSNICPQKNELNNGRWKKLEERCHYWAKKYDEIYIVCGPVIDKGVNRTIGKRKISVPEKFFKAILRQTDKETVCIGYVFTQKNVATAVSVDDIEKMTGLDLFHNLPDNLEEKIESTFNERDWR